MKTDAKHGLINEAKRYAREAIHETWPTAIEIIEPTASMYEFDAICIDDMTCPIISVSIMHDPDADAFALVENFRPINPPKEKIGQAPVFHFDGTIDWDKLSEEHAIAYLRGDLATSSPASYTIEEMKAISDDMFASTAVVDAAIRKEFNALPPVAQACMLELLEEADPDNMDFWKEALGLKMPEAPPVA